jgi:type IV pilus assembly protein PilB
VRKICPDCRKEQTLPEALAKQIEGELVGVPDVYYDGITKGKIQLFKGEGCEKCERTGYKGRLGIYEVLPMTQEIQELILSKVPSAKVVEAASKLGMISMRQDGIIKVLRGETTLEEVARVTKE